MIYTGKKHTSHDGKKIGHEVRGFLCKAHMRSGIMVRQGCAGKITQLMGGDYCKVTQVLSWGYKGKGPKMLALWLLLMSNSSVLISTETETYEVEINTHAEMLSLCDELMAQVTSKLPDEWVITTDEIHEWIGSRTLPKCLRPKRKREACTS